MGEILDQAHGAGDGFGGAFDFGEAGVFEEVGVEHRPQHGGNVVVGLEVGVLEHFDGFGVAGRGFLPGGDLGFVGDEEVVEVAGDEAGGGGLAGDDVDDFLAAEIAGFAEEGFFAVVVVVGVEDELGFVAAIGVAGDGVGDGPAGEGAGAFFYVILGVVGLAVHADAHREEFEEFAAEVFVDGVFVAHAVVEVEDHRGVAGQFQQQIAEAAHTEGAEQIQLGLDLASVFAFGVAGAEDAVPEEGHFFLQGALGVDHPIGEVSLVDFEGVHFAPVDEVAVEDVAVEVGLVHGGKEFLDGGLVADGGAALDFGVGGAETGAAHKVGH